MVIAGIILAGLASFLLYSAGIQHRNENTKKILDSNKTKLDRNSVILNTNRFLTDLREFQGKWNEQFETQRAKLSEIDISYLKDPAKHAYESEKNHQAEISIHREYLQKYNQKFRFEGKRLKKELETLLSSYKTSEITYGVYDRVYLDLDLQPIIDDLENLILKLRSE